MTSTPPDLSRLRIDRDQPAPGQTKALKWTLGLAGAAGLFLAAVFLLPGRNAAVDVQVARAEVVGAGTVGGAGITANGYVVARTRASVSSRISGRITALVVEEGSVVRRGQVMAQLENAEFVAAVEQAVAENLRAEASLNEARTSRDQLQRDLVRARDLAARNLEPARTAEDLAAQLAGAEARVEAQKAQVQLAIAGIAYARANLDNTYIRAPFDGTILRKDAELGEVVAPVATGGGLTRGAVVTMADLQTLEVEVDVNEAYIAQIKSGQPARVILDAYPTANFQAEVRQIVPTADRQRATVQVKVRLLERDPRILPEMGARVEFLEEATAAPDAPPRVFAPADAVRNAGNSTIVWVVRDGLAARVTVDAGPVSGGRREIRSGLTGGETLILTPPSNLADGARVNVITP
jgi:RND family efflux transporter MFP subunit